jgi:hypothetical protein
MKISAASTIVSLALLGSATAQNLYYVGQEAQESIPLTWNVGANVVWDNNVNPSALPGDLGYEQEQWSINPYVEANLTTITPQSSLNFYSRVGANFYFDDMEAQGSDELTPNIKVGVDYSHSFSERLRFSSRNYLTYEMEPEYAYGLSTDRGIDPYFYYSTDNSIGYRWTERVGSYTGLAFTGYLDDTGYADRSSWAIYHQMRYQLTQRAVWTGMYRFEQWSGDASDSTNHFLTTGIEYRMSQNSVFVGNVGVQIRDVDDGDSSTSPYLDASIRTNINSRFSIRGFARYSMEDYDSIQFIGATPYEYSDQQVFRLGVTGDYKLSPRLTGYGGVDFVHTAYDSGFEIGGPATDDGRASDLMNVYIGLRAKFTDQLSGQCSINYTDSVSDFERDDYDRLRLSAGVNYSF